MSILESRQKSPQESDDERGRSSVASRDQEPLTERRSTVASTAPHSDSQVDFVSISVTETDVSLHTNSNDTRKATVLPPKSQHKKGKATSKSITKSKKKTRKTSGAKPGKRVPAPKRASARSDAPKTASKTVTTEKKPNCCCSLE